MTKIPRLFELLKETNTSQKQLAEYIGASQGNISDWKSGKAVPASEKLCAIADFFNVSVDYLLGRTDVRTPAAETAQPLTTGARGEFDGWLNQLSEPELHELAVYIQFLLYKRGL